MKTRELTGTALDWAVAVCEGINLFETEGWVYSDGKRAPFRPSSDWRQGGFIIEREVICIGSGLDAPTWYANQGCGKHHRFGPTPLIAAMRCFVASRLGDEVKIPDILGEAE
jgi:hypothetical protein